MEYKISEQLMKSTVLTLQQLPFIQVHELLGMWNTEIAPQQKQQVTPAKPKEGQDETPTANN